jgi:excinuclease UvrABC nuclease subunit
MIYYFNAQWDIESKALIYDTADLLLTKLRDEAHRFANKYRTTRMSQQWK